MFDPRDTRPFPRYLVALCYAVLHRQLLPQTEFDACSTTQKTALADALWKNIVDTGNLIPYPSAMLTVLTDQFSPQELLTRSLPLLANDRPTANTVGDTLLNQLTIDNAPLAEQLIKALQQAIKTETDPTKKQKYQAYLNGRSRSTLHSIANLINPWKR